MAFLLGDMRARWEDLDGRIAAFDAEFATMARNDDRARRLTGIPGIGALNATALVAAVGSAATFGKGRDLAAWLGLVPRQATTGGKPRLLGITKRGSRYLRKMLIQGARSAMPTLARADTAVGAWLRALLRRAHPNVAVVALAAKMARTVWALPCGRSCATAGATIPCRWPRAEEHAPDQTAAGRDKLRVVRGRWPDSRTAFREPPAQNGPARPAPL